MDINRIGDNPDSCTHPNCDCAQRLLNENPISEPEKRAFNLTESTDKALKDILDKLELGTISAEQAYFRIVAI